MLLKLLEKKLTYEFHYLKTVDFFADKVLNLNC